MCHPYTTSGAGNMRPPLLRPGRLSCVDPAPRPTPSARRRAGVLVSAPMTGFATDPPAIIPSPRRPPMRREAPRAMVGSTALPNSPAPISANGSGMRLAAPPMTVFATVGTTDLPAKIVRLILAAAAGVRPTVLRSAAGMVPARLRRPPASAPAPTTPAIAGTGLPDSIFARGRGGGGTTTRGTRSGGAGRGRAGRSQMDLEGLTMGGM